jgi:glycosyltransferase involved in cell wall biosynthesis
MITYNQELYIAEAIEGVLMQKTAFEVELVIGEDGSKDNTRAIVIDYCHRFPGRIRLLPDEGNLGMMKNMVRTLKACRGRYVAMCEGDDYWIDEQKLQKQVDFMETHPEYSFCFHATEHRFPDAKKNFVQREFPVDTTVNLDQIILKGGAFIPTPTLLFRGELVDSLPDWCINARIGDYPLTIHVALHGLGWAMYDCMAVYRRQAVGAWSSGWTWWRHKHLVFGNNRMLFAINKATNGRHFWVITRTLLDSNWGLLKAMFFAILRPGYNFIKRIATCMKRPFIKTASSHTLF